MSLTALTGEFPYNAEPPLSTIFEGSNDHFVRNHCKVPYIEYDKHNISIFIESKLIKNINMNYLKKFKYHDIPITLVCAGNRRKEVNMIKRSIGFDWGASALSSSVWGGIKLRDMIVSLKINTNKYNFINFTGADESPKGSYGTSISVNYAMRDDTDVLIAYKMNGQNITPNNGFPVRCIVPGFIAGRSVKWLSKIEFSNEESNSHYHYYDNRLLPPEINSMSIAIEKQYIYKIDYMVNELNVNSVICKPFHNEHISTCRGANKKYAVSGYAYSGGGRKITRIDVQVDNEWISANIIYTPAGMIAPGRDWSMCFWVCYIDVNRLYDQQYISVRAVDDALNTQPENIIWNLYGIMNNVIYKIKIISRNGYLVFIHPVANGSDKGGWMKNIQNEKIKTQNKPFMTKSEVRKHATYDDCYIIIDNKVFDCTYYMKDHPGGDRSIMNFAGKDCTNIFNSIHSDLAWKLIEEMYVYNLLDENKNTKCEKIELVDKKYISNSMCLEFNISQYNHLKFNLGCHCIISYDNVSRTYTPVMYDKKTFSIIVKYYEHGRMSNILRDMKIGDSIILENIYNLVKWEDINQQNKNVVYVAQGSGITPVLGLINHNKINGSIVIYCEKYFENLILTDNMSNIQLRIVISREKNEKNEKNAVYDITYGHIDEDVMKKNITKDSIILVSGSSSFYENIRKYTPDDIETIQW
jgi:DMSO/TMAO reductase YedYZ molybdopterin-dependent catalytic subunit/cytochrome b involved in lipid metabolism/ferredoxin-NADP reductase